MRKPRTASRLEVAVWTTMALLTVTAMGLVVYAWGVPMPSDPDASGLASAPNMAPVGTLLLLLPAVSLVVSVPLARFGRRE